MNKLTYILWLIITAQFVCAQTMDKHMDKNLMKVKQDRAFFETLGKIYPADKDILLTHEKIAGINCYWFKQKDEEIAEILIYLHGGSFAMGSINSHQSMVSHIAKEIQIPVLFIEYALAPENPYPTALNEVIKVYKEILKQHPTANIFIMGDSAGGGLAVANVFTIQESGLKSPGGVILLSPWLNLRCNTSSYKTRKHLDPILKKDDLLRYASYYAGDKMQSADPSLLNFTEFPPVFLLVGSNEILFDDSKNFYESIRKIQIKSKFKEYAGQTHVWLLTDISSDSAKQALEDIHGFIKDFSY